MAAHGEHWAGIRDPEARFLYQRLYDELEGYFARVEPQSVAYDGILWAVRSGVVRGSRNESLNLLPLTLRRGIHIPGLFRAEVSLPGIHHSYYEYSENGGFNLERNGILGSEVYRGQYVSMHDMVAHMRPDHELTAVAATNITMEWWNAHPDELPPVEVFGMLPHGGDSPPRAA